MQSLDEYSWHASPAQAWGVSQVLFISPSCGSSRTAQRLLPSAAPADVRLYVVDVQQALARAYDVFHLPALFLFRDGRYHARLDCAITPAALRGAIDAALAAPPQEEP